MKMLISNNAELHGESSKPKYGTPLTAALTAQQYHIAEYLIGSQKVDVNKKCSNGKSCLMQCVAKENIRLVNRLLDNKHINLEQTYRGMTAFDYAAKEGNTEICDYR
eukprot:UN33689